MADVDLEALVKDMGKAALPFLKAGAARAREYGKAEADKMARTAVLLAKGVAAGTIDEDEANLVLDVQRNASRSILLTIKGLGIVSVEKAINAAMEVLRKGIEAATGVVL
ncbi:MAG TPA: hypothetical protein VFZ65_03305 [Planctomycetota bacterium]|nr:hypothetical protein [Planctomycetota bacterium]